jgi:CSLREA domain-containing protein
MLLSPWPALAQLQYTVNSTGDAADISPRNGICETVPGNGVCTLRAAIMESNAQVGTDSISFRIPTSDAGYNPQTGVYTITLTSALPNITDSATIRGPGAAKLTVSPAIGNFRVFNVTSTGLTSIVSISGMTIANGRAPYNESGGGLQNTASATVNIDSCVFRQNQATALIGNNFGGAIYNIFGKINVTNSTFDRNTASNQGGAIYNNTGTVTVVGSTFKENGAFSAGGALYNYSGALTVANSTFVTNIAYKVDANGTQGNGGAIANEIGTLKLTNSTITANLAGYSGGGIYNNAGPASVKSTIIAQNLGGTSAGTPDAAGTFTSLGFNLIGKRDGSSGFTATTDKKGTIASPLIPKFDAKGLRNNGGPTETVALQSTSPAVDKGTSAGLTGALATDQRGTGFLRKVDKATANAAGGDGTDIGAYELQ